jgi:PKD repeat protein
VADAYRVAGTCPGALTQTLGLLLRTTFAVTIVLSLLIVPATGAVQHRPADPGISLIGPSVAGGAAQQSVRPQTGISLVQEGIDPTVVSFGWTKSTDSFFNNYSFAYSAGSSGPWTTLSVINSANLNFEWVYGVSPGDTYYWQLTEYDCFFGCSSTSSNVLETTQPAFASLSYTNPTSTSVKLTWDNNAAYGGNLSFSSYQVMESVAGGAYSSTATITSFATYTYTINGLSSGSGYSFYINTTDTASSFGTTYLYWSPSNPITFGTTVALSASATAQPSTSDVGQKVSVSCAAAGGSAPYTYAWTFGDGSTGSGQTASHTYTSPGDYTATCTVTDSASTKAAGATSIAISPDPQVSATANHVAASPGFSITFTADASAGSGSFTSYAWSFGDGGSSSGSSVSHAYTRAGSFNATVTVTDSNGEQASGRVGLSIANLSITAGATKTVIAPGAAVDFTASATGGGGAPYTFSWNFGDGMTGSGTSVDHTYTTTGNFTPRVTVTDGLGSTNSTALATVQVLSPLVAQITLSSSNPTPGQSVTLTAKVTGGSGQATCQWNFGDSNSGTGCTVAHSWATSGSFNVTLTVADPEAGNTTSHATVSVTAAASGGSTLGSSVGGISDTLLLAVILVIVVVAVAALLLARGRGKPTKSTGGSNTRLCPKCGTPLGAGAAFCQKCGQPVAPK